MHLYGRLTQQLEMKESAVSLSVFLKLHCGSFVSLNYIDELAKSTHKTWIIA